MFFQHNFAQNSIILHSKFQKIVLGTLLRLISGHDDPGLVQTGNFTYNSRKAENWRLRRLATYVHQVDYHHPKLTVQETFDFAAQSTNDRSAKAIEMSCQGKRLNFKADNIPNVEIVKSKFGSRKIKLWRQNDRNRIKFLLSITFNQKIDLNFFFYRNTKFSF